ncbi:unnamed protein product [Leptosia nina]|uniref:Secreted protein n=1 Tax=Leptosia nina TaxID=320188 RepID=A0AAV1J5G1_9NEOP
MEYVIFDVVFFILHITCPHVIYGTSARAETIRGRGIITSVICQLRAIGSNLFRIPQGTYISPLSDNVRNIGAENVRR